MKQFLWVMSLVAGSLLYSSTVSSTETPSEALLQQMAQASRSLNYELAYINISKIGLESLRYRHAVVNNQVFAQLLQMDGSRREILQRDNNISYFDASNAPFTLKGSYIVDALPALVNANFEQLNHYYKFIPVGHLRVADQLCDVIRIIPRDATRYSYIVWLDKDTKLPLRIDLLDQGGETLEQYRVVSFAIDEGVRKLMQGLSEAKLPPLLLIPTAEKKTFNWKPNWLPAGMTLLSQSHRYLPALGKMVESQFYSDGLFSFSINITSADKNSAMQLLHTGRHTVQIVVRNNVEITVVGEIPPLTSKRIIDGIVLRTTP